MKLLDVLNWDKISKISQKTIILQNEITQMTQNLYEVPLKNIKIKDDLLTCILNNKEEKFKIQHRKANTGELIYIIQTENMRDFCKKNLHKCFRVLKSCVQTEWTRGYVLIGNEHIMDGQYVVLNI